MTSLVEPHRDRGESYVEHFAFLEPPFPDTPGPRFDRGTESRARALEEVTYGIHRREGMIVVAGEEGTGKTTLCLALPRHLGPRTFASVVLKPPAAPDDLLEQLLLNFGLLDSHSSEPPAIGTPDRDDRYFALQGFLLSLAPLQAHAVVVIDQAHALSLDVLAEIVRLSNFGENHPGLLQIVLVGQPLLLDRLQQPPVGRLYARVARRLTLRPFTHAEVATYVERQIWIARGGVAAFPVVSVFEGPPAGARGGSGPRFTSSAIGLIARRSSGNPRTINLICSRALALARDSATDRITGHLARRAAADVGLPWDARRVWIRSKGVAASMMVAMMAAAALVSASWRERAPLPGTTAVEALRQTPDQPFDERRREALRLGASLSREPNVKALLKLGDEVRHWDIDAKDASHKAVEDLLAAIERLTNEARQRQLEVDRALFFDAAKTNAP